MELSAAATFVDITPPADHPMGGYAARTLDSTGTHDPLTGTLIRLAGAGSDLVWLAMDALAVDVEVGARLRAAVGRAAGIDPDAVIVCASHTHAGPGGWLTPPYPGFPSRRDGRLTDALVKTVGAAARELRPLPVRPFWSTCPGVGVGTNRNDRNGPHDDTAGVLTLRGERGPMVVVADYACHPTVLGSENRRYSADFPGAARRVAAAALSATGAVRPVLAFLQGAAGDASARFTRRGQSFAEVDRIGGIVGAAIVRGSLLGQPLAGQLVGRQFSGEPLAGGPTVRRATVEVPTRIMPSPELVRAEVTRTEREWRAAGDPTSPAARIARTRYEGARMLAARSGAGLPATLTLPISAVTLGGVAWVHLPVEPFASHGAAIAAASPYPVTRVIGYTDGYFGYLADSAAHAAGSYEARASLFDPAAGTVLVDAAIGLLTHK